MNNEIWSKIDPADREYWISNYGRVKSKFKMLKPQNVNGYRQIYLTIGGKRIGYYIHQLVAKAFIANPSNYTEINHKDGKKANNFVENIEWSSRSHNNLHAYRLGLKIPYDRSGSNNPKFRHGKKIEINVNKNCKFCDVPFIAKYVTTEFCSLPCVARYNAMKINHKIKA
jgi:hypothetical protein